MKKSFVTVALAALFCAALPARAVFAAAPELSNISVTDMDGKKISIATVKGNKIAVLAFWTPLADAAAAELEKFARAVQGKDREIVIIPIAKGADKEERQAALRKAREMGIKGGVYFDPDLSVVKALGVKSVPWFVLAGADNSVLSSCFNSIETKFRNLTVSRILAETGSGRDVPYHEFVPSGGEDGVRRLIGERAPDFNAPDLRNNRQSLKKYKGEKSVFLVFWRESCPHCREEMPKLQQFYLKYREKKSFEIIGVAIAGNKDDAARTKKYVSENMITFPIVIDGGNEVSPEYNLQKVPTIIYVDKRGIVRETHSGSAPDFDRLMLSFLGL